ncbi:CBM_HP2_G0028240.mRNA.1.CDS.1 [Saccharomyces cerevisiae]|nr:CBM_HP2_G0028240.mRNA.1.CDS.1 [Saccharomyces cerevisiae]CAI6648946.1 CBM_HP2_G0028240.mRNA.1.CDS.1 [Saccharomyces cerevisiae]
MESNWRTVKILENIGTGCCRWCWKLQRGFPARASPRSRMTVKDSWLMLPMSLTMDTRESDDLYYKSDPQILGRTDRPSPVDRETPTIVNNESSEVLRILNSSAFDEFVDDDHKKTDLVPAQLKTQIDDFNSWVYDSINNGVYKTGFAEKAEVYESEVNNVFEHLDKVEKILSDKYSKLKAKYGEEDRQNLGYRILYVS